MQHDAIRTAEDSNDEIRTSLRCGDYLDQQIETVSVCIRRGFFDSLSLSLSLNDRFARCCSKNVVKPLT